MYTLDGFPASTLQLLYDPQEILAIINARMMPALQLQLQVLQHSQHVPFVTQLFVLPECRLQVDPVIVGVYEAARRVQTMVWLAEMQLFG